MVEFNEQARIDLENIFDGLLGWKTSNGYCVYTYKRNAKTIWYIIYNIIHGDIFIEKIMNNYLTISSL